MCERLFGLCARVSPLLLVSVLLGSTCLAADVKMVVCAPGYPGSTAEAQPAMDGFAAAVSGSMGSAGKSFGAEYFETEADGVSAFEEGGTGFGLVTLPFFLEHSDSLGLQPEMLAVPTGRQAEESWSLVAGKGRVRGPEDLDGWQLMSLAGHSKSFVRGPALGDWGELPSTVAITFSGAVLSSLRKAARGDNVVVLLDAEQTDALDRLPFSDDLEIVHQSSPLPVSVVCSVGNRVDAETKAELMEAFAKLADRPEAAQALAGVRLERFESLDPRTLDGAIAAFDGVAE